VWPRITALPRRSCSTPRGCASSGSGDAHRPRQAYGALIVEEEERLLRRLALNDEESIGMVLTSNAESDDGAALVPKAALLVQLGALLALGAATASLKGAVRRVRAAGATESEIVGVLIAIAPAIGLAKVVSIAPRLAAAIGYEIDADE
jgi:alkylhydroperoxidase/carboxymuconolactone decarboxylase family protein YurZ